ncbi:Macrolide export protein MacA [Pontiella desulfatans]|uniref:Macrolide export protein MacA n=1 Tax=Pontiella desulfatans TaxID=2750659 RepID=A0A6C2TZX3_PONDE|nr:efflux RND transporter periplasmic adaptor subunit [Pontiella desulfatans]VGO12901.1 Macrolide export protein MacA [Pontiella desulfatans]
MKLNKQMITGVGGGLLALAVIVLVSAAGAKKKEAAKHENEGRMAFNNTPRPVRYETVAASPLHGRRAYPGIVKASEETALSFRVGGPLTEVNVKLGKTVKKGELLMQIDPRDFEDRIASLEAQLSGAEAVQANADQDYKRIAGLFEEKVVPQSDYDKGKSGLDSADAAVENIKVQLQIARHALKDTSLFAPYDGTVTEQLVENHEMINPGETVLRYHNIQQLEIVVNIPENEIIATPIKSKSKVSVSFPSIRSRSFEARLTEWSTQADALTRTYVAIFEMEAPEGVTVLPGMTATVEPAQADDVASVLTVPVSALVSDTRKGNAVWIYDAEQGKAQLRPVVIGALNGESRVVVVEGLVEGDQVVVTGSRLIHEQLSLETAANR